VPVRRDRLHFVGVTLDFTEELRLQLIAMVYELIELLAPGRAEGFSALQGLSLLLPEPATQSFAGGRDIFWRKEIFDVRVREHENAVLVRLEGLGRAVGLFDGIAGEERRHAMHVIMRADGENKTHVLGVLR